MNFFQKYKKSIIGGLIGLMIAGVIPGSIWLHDAYADDRYVQQVDQVRSEIQQIDHALFEIDQEITFAEDAQERAKWQARKEYYERQKQALRDQLPN